MTPLYSLIVYIVFIGIIGYLITLGTFKLLEAIISKTKGGLAGIFFFIVIASSIFVTINKDNAPEYLEKIQFWKSADDRTVYLFE